MKNLLVTVTAKPAAGIQTRSSKTYSFDTERARTEYVASQLGLLQYSKGYFVESVGYESIGYACVPGSRSIILTARAVKRFEDGTTLVREFEAF